MSRFDQRDILKALDFLYSKLEDTEDIRWNKYIVDSYFATSAGFKTRAQFQRIIQDLEYDIRQYQYQMAQNKDEIEELNDKISEYKELVDWIELQLSTELPVKQQKILSILNCVSKYTKRGFNLNLATISKELICRKRRLSQHL